MMCIVFLWFCCYFNTNYHTYQVVALYLKYNCVYYFTHGRNVVGMYVYTLFVQCKYINLYSITRYRLFEMYTYRRLLTLSHKYKSIFCFHS